MKVEKPPIDVSPPSKQRRLGRLETALRIGWILTLGGFVTYEGHKLYHDFEVEKARRAFAALPIDLRYILADCDDRGTVLFYDVQYDDSVHDVARKAGLVPFYKRVPPTILNPWNPAFNDGNPESPGRDPDFIKGYLETDVLALPNTPRTHKFLKESGQFPFPGHPEDIASWLQENDPHALESLDERAKAVVTLFATNNPELSESREELGDLCIFTLNKKGRELNYETVREVLAEYTAEYLQSDYIRIMLDQHLPIFLPGVNQLLANSDVSHSLPENIGEYAIFTAMSNDVGGGFASFALRPYFVVIGNYAHLNNLTYELNRDTDNIFRKTLFHEALHTIQPSNNNLTISEWNFAHSAMGFVTLPSQYLSIGTFRPEEAVDPRVQIVYQHLVASGIERHEAYKMIVRASIDFAGLDKIKAIYNKTIHNDDLSFEELFRNQDLDYEINPILKEYVVSSHARVDFNNLYQTMTEIIKPQTSAMHNDGRRRDFNGRLLRRGEVFELSKTQGRSEVRSGRFRGSKPVRVY